MSVMVFDHPLIKHKVAILRSKDTPMKEFRELIEEITLVMSYEAFKDAPTQKVTVETPLEVCEQEMVVEHSIAIVPILRAGLGMVNGVHKIFPGARVGHIGMYRDEETAEPHEYYCKLPEGIENMNV
ncbi:MAG: uracil phosphoribosyltransferase, partial [Christensenellaceae bacterium]